MITIIRNTKREYINSYEHMIIDIELEKEREGIKLSKVTYLSVFRNYRLGRHSTSVLNLRVHSTSTHVYITFVLTRSQSLRVSYTCHVQAIVLVSLISTLVIKS